MWPTSPEELIEAQRALAVAEPEPWHPRSPSRGIHTDPASRSAPARSFFLAA